MDPTVDGGLLWIAEAALCAPLPKGWAEYTDAKGNVYFHKVSEGASTWEHPLDDHFRTLYKAEKAKPPGEAGPPPASSGGDELKYLDGIRCAEARSWWRSMIGSKEAKVSGLSDTLSRWLEDKGQSQAESQRLTNAAIEKMGRNAEGKVSFEEFNAFVEMHMSSAFTVDQMQSTVARIEIAMEAEQQDRPQQARAGLDMGEIPRFQLDSDRSGRSEAPPLDDGAGLGELDRGDEQAAMEAEQRRKDKDARKRKKKKEKKRRERERARLEAERAGGDGGGLPATEGGGVGGSPQGPSGHALDMMGGGGFGSGDDDEYSSPLNSGRGQDDGGLDGLYDEVFSGAPDTGVGMGGGGGGGGDLGGFRPLSKKPPPARLPTLGGGGGLPGLPEPGSLPGLPGGGGGGGGGRPDLAAFATDLPPKPATLGGLGGLAPLGGGGGGGGGSLGGLAPLKPLGGLAALPLPGRGGGPELDEFGAPKLPP
jgi:hypothetical protein